MNLYKIMNKYDKIIEDRYIEETEFKNIQMKKRIFYEWRKLKMVIKNELNPLIKSDLYVDVNTKRKVYKIQSSIWNKYLFRLSETLKDNKFKCNECDNIVENEFKVVINKLYLFRRTYCEECYLELKKQSS